ncbi:hypothetical protein [Rhodoferax sp.]|uniref:hypothetical protein n=1 Tax=Rhodoferax sp. TaxID=50421 RepID=UPI0027465596|nr:hypothetical protein [Rhodoferax sp.]
MRGEFHLADERVPELGRSSRVASLQVLGDGKPRLALFDAALMHADSTRLVLSGFERECVNAQLVDVSQTWVMELATEVARARLAVHRSRGDWIMSNFGRAAQY